MNINPVAPVHWAGQDHHGQTTPRQRFASDETLKAAETKRPVDAVVDIKAAQAEAKDAPRAAPPSVLQLKIQEMLNEQADNLEETALDDEGTV